MTMLEKRIPPLLLVVIFGAAMWLVASITPLLSIDGTLLAFVAVAVFAIGTLFSVAGVIAFRQAQTTVDPRTPEASSDLVSSGIYRYSRNPMYVGFALWLLAWGIFLGSGWALLGVVVFVLYMNRFQIAPEERALRDLFGDTFRDYEQRVRRWL
ncbi:methyltransferase family protein [Marinobacter lipolyticus]|uniref:methyltransferase family protein n=1 Tax=Marinobacter lipolyticus TaxID=209639 RepID=UPI003A9263F8